MQNDYLSDAWSQARAKFCEGLTPDEALLFSTATLETVIEETRLPVVKHKPGRIAHGIETVVAAIAQYGDALDVFSSSAPLVLGPLWESLRVVLHLASEYGEYFEKLLKMFTSIGDMLPRFGIYEKLFPNNDRLRNHLSNAYLEILRFCTSAKLIFTRKRPSAVYLNVLFRSSWKPFKQEFGAIIDAFRQHQKNIEKEANLSHMLEANKNREKEIEARSVLVARQKSQERVKILGLLSAVPWKAFHSRQQRLRHSGTGIWLQETPEFKRWVSEANSSCLLCCGSSGVGKTVLCSSIVDHIRGLSTKPTVAYHYFDYLDQQTMSIAGVLGSIMQQILLSMSTLPDAVEKVLSDIYIDGITTPLAEELTEALRLTLESSPKPMLPTYIFVDGVDECNKDLRDDLLLAINSLMDLTTTVIKVFISFREDDVILRMLKRFPCKKLHEAQLSGDIVVYVKDTVRHKIENGLLVIKNPELEQEIVSELISKAGGMFLWVSLQMEEICDNTQSDASIRETLRNLPIGLEATYKRIVEKIEIQSIRQRKIAQSILEWVVCAKRPLTMLELKEGIFFEPGQRSWDGTRIPSDQSNKSLIQTCRNLVTLDDYDGTIRLAHHTVEGFLTSPSNTISESFLTNARERVKDMCMSYLMFSDFEIQITRPGPAISLAPLETFASATVSQTTSALGISNLVSIPSQLWKGHLGHWQRSHLDADLGRSVQIRGDPRADLAPWAKYSLLEYIKFYWVTHVLDFSSENDNFNDDSWNSFRYLVLEKKMAFSFLPWDLDFTYAVLPDSGDPNLPYLRLFYWALENGHYSLMQLLTTPDRGLEIAKYIIYAYNKISQQVEGQPEQVVARSFKPFMELFVSAADHGHVEIVESILENHPLDHQCWIKAIYDHPEVVARVLNYKFAFPSTWKALVLCSAIGQGDTEISNLLLGNFSREEIMDCMCRAAEVGDLSMLVMFLRSKLLCGKLLHSQILINACRWGHIRLVQKLLENEVKEGDRLGTSLLEVEVRFTTYAKLEALFSAAAEGHDTIVRFILQTEDIPKSVFCMLDPRMLISAYENGHIPIIIQVLQSKVEITSPKAISARSWARRKGYNDLAKMLPPLPPLPQNIPVARQVVTELQTSPLEAATSTISMTGQSFFWDGVDD